MNKLERRVVDISYEQNLSHIGSCLTVLPILDEIYSQKKSGDRVILDGGHAHVAHLVIKEKYEGKKIGKIHDIHCNKKDKCDVPTGSLGQGLPIAVGMALAKKAKNIYCIVTDGSMAEGSNWEALRIADELELDNLKIYCNANNFSAYNKIDADLLEARMNIFNPRIRFVRTKFPSWSFVKDKQAFHYIILNKDQYDDSIK